MGFEVHRFWGVGCTSFIRKFTPIMPRLRRPLGSPDQTTTLPSLPVSHPKPAHPSPPSRTPASPSPAPDFSPPLPTDSPSLQLPFTIHNVEQFADAVSRGYRPPRLACIPDLVWAVISDCWQSDPLLRPPMTAVVEQLHSIREHWEKAASATAGEGEGGSRSIGGRIIDSFTFTCLRGGRGGDGSCEGVRRSRSPRVELKVKGCRDCVIC